MLLLVLLALWSLSFRCVYWMAATHLNYAISTVNFIVRICCTIVFDTRNEFWVCGFFLFCIANFYTNSLELFCVKAGATGKKNYAKEWMWTTNRECVQRAHTTINREMSKRVFVQIYSKNLLLVFSVVLSVRSICNWIILNLSFFTQNKYCLS